MISLFFLFPPIFFSLQLWLFSTLTGRGRKRVICAGSLRSSQTHCIAGELSGDFPNGLGRARGRGKGGESSLWDTPLPSPLFARAGPLATRSPAQPRCGTPWPVRGVPLVMGSGGGRQRSRGCSCSFLTENQAVCVPGSTGLPGSRLPAPLDAPAGRPSLPGMLFLRVWATPASFLLQ